MHRTSATLFPFAVPALLLLLGCASAREAGRHPGEDPESGGVQVAIFADDDAREAGSTLAEPVSGVLERREGRSWVPLFRSLESSWAIAGLEPGRYRVRFDSRLDDRGQPEALERPLIEEVRVAAGEVVDVEVVLDHVSPAMVAAGAAAVIVAAVLLHEWLGDLDLPTPPPPPAWALDAAFWITVDLAAQPRSWIPRDRAPQVTSHFPRQDERIAAASVRVVFALSEPIDPARGFADAIRVTTADGRELAGRVDWVEESWWLTWEPERDLPRDSVIDVTLLPESVVDRVGAPIRRSVHFSFRTTP